MNEYQREELIRDVEKTTGWHSKLLSELKISRTTYYRWRRAYVELYAKSPVGRPGRKPEIQYINFQCRAGL